MTEETNEFTHVGVLIETQKKIAILAKVLGPNIYGLVGSWTDASWQIAKDAGLVTDAMLKPFQAHVVGKEKIVEFDVNDGKKLLNAVKLRPSKSKRAVKA
jgi:hypothetical protein